MGAWLQHLPAMDLVRVYLDDRCLLDLSPARIAQAPERTQTFDHLFGMEIHPRKSVRFQIGNPTSHEAARWLALPECTVIKYLGVALQTTLVANFELGDGRAAAVKAKILRARALPKHDTRRGLLPAFLQGLYSEGSALSKRATPPLSARRGGARPCMSRTGCAVLRTHTSLLGPLHRLAPSAVQFYGIVISLGPLFQWAPALVQRLWRAFQGGDKFLGLLAICIGLSRLFPGVGPARLHFEQARLRSSSWTGSRALGRAESRHAMSFGKAFGSGGGTCGMAVGRRMWASGAVIVTLLCSLCSRCGRVAKTSDGMAASEVPDMHGSSLTLCGAAIVCIKLSWPRQRSAGDVGLKMSIRCICSGAVQ